MPSLLPVAMAAAAAAGLIFDTDMGNDVDDALALSVIHALESRGEVKLLAVTVTKDNRYAAPFCDIVNTFYGRGRVPIGVVRDGKAPEDNPMIKVPVESRPAYPHLLRDYRKAPEAVALIRKTLAASADGSVNIVQVGFSTNLARFLDTPGAADLIRRKVRLLSVMAGDFSGGKPEYNVRIDIESASKVIHEWPGPMILSGYEIGTALLYPAFSIENDFGWAPRHPVVDSYRAYKKMPYDRPTWDLTSVLVALRPGHDYFELSDPGRVTVSPDGRTTHTADPNGNRRYLKLNAQQRIRVLETLIQLASQPR